MDSDKVCQMLRDAYSRETEKRGMAVSFDEPTLSRISKVAKWLTSGDMKPMLLLHGGTGSGKTTMVKAIKRLCDTIRGISMHKMAFSVMSAVKCPVICTAQELASIAAADSARFHEVTERSFLVIDDLGCEPVAVRNWGTEVTPITDVFYRRYEKMLPTIVTTNLAIKDIRSRYGDRVADRFNEVFETIGYTNASYRK